MKANPHLSLQDLSSLELFDGLSAPVLDEVIALTRCRSLARDIRIFNQGDNQVRAHLLIEGSVRISQSGSDGGQIVVRFIGPGEMFGAVALFTDGKYPADADTLTEATEISWSDLGDATKLCGACDRLEDLTLRSGSMKLGKPGEFVFPHLKKLSIITGGFSKANLKAIEGAHLPSLESLTLYFGTDRYGCDIKRKDLDKLLASDRFPRLTHLGLVSAALNLNARLDAKDGDS